MPMSKNAVLPLLALTLLLAAAGVACRGFFVNPVLSSINVAPQNASLNIGATLQFTASGVNNDGTTASLHNLTWTTSSAQIATISTGGLAKGVSAGTATITATDGTISGSATLNVGSTTSQLLISPANPTVALTTGTLQFTSTFNGQTVTASTTWTSSNQSVATFNSLGAATGQASLVGTGTTTITATFTPSGGTQASASTTLTVQ
jgi:hypothetical protein